jgi:ADP-ribosylation factor-like protein 8
MNGFQQDKFKSAKFELHQLLAQPTLTGVPLLVVRSKKNCHFYDVTYYLTAGQ